MQGSSNSDLTWTIGFKFFTALLLIIVGTYQIVAGISGIFNDNFSTPELDYILEMDPVAWGWLHLITGSVCYVAATGLILGITWARILTIAIAMWGAISNFAFLPIYPVWAVVLIIINLAIVWVLSVHGQEIDEAE